MGDSRYEQKVQELVDQASELRETESRLDEARSRRALAAMRLDTIRAELAEIATTCAHENLALNASTGVEIALDGTNAQIGVTVRCLACSKTWTDDIVAGIGESVKKRLAR